MAAMAGNATVTLSNGGGTATYEIWLTNISTSSNTEFAMQQVRDGVSWIPIRRAEMFFNFTAIWAVISSNSKPKKRDLGFENIDPADGFAKMHHFQNAIRGHQQSVINGSIAKPMIVNYFNNSDPKSHIFNTLIDHGKPLQSLQYSGYIQNVEKPYIRFQNVYTTSYTMNIIQPNTAGTFPTNEITSNSYAPTAADQLAYGNGWIDINHLAAVINNVQGLPK